MSSNADAAIDLERFELRLFPNDPPPSCDLQAEESRLPYDLSAPLPGPALVRVVERFGLPVRPLVATRGEGEEDEYQVLCGGAWIRAAREAGLDRVPVRALELPDLQAALLALVLNQPQPADVAAQADALQALLEAGVDEQDLARASGLGRGRLRRLGSLLELHPVLRQALREGCLRPQVAFAVSGLSPSSQDELAALYQREGELTGADLERVGEDASGPDGAASPGLETVADGSPGAAPGRDTAAEPGAREDPAARARRQAAELLRTLEQTGIADEIRQRVAEVVEQLGRIAVGELSAGTGTSPPSSDRRFVRS
jgi:ParB-like chromosome segregation protein Spo0J